MRLAMPPRSSPYLRPLVVLVHDGAGRPRRVAFLRSPVRIGRDPAAEVVLDAPWVSGRHGLLQFDDAAVEYTDLGSRNGSAVAGARAAPGVPIRLGPGAEVAIGALRLGFERGALPGGREVAGGHETIRPGALTALLRELARTPEADAGDAWAASLHPGLTVGRFELLRELGRGGFGVVYEARDRQLGRRVAFKAVRVGGAAAAGGDEWLQREAEAAAQLSHPHIVQLYDAGTWEGGPYLIYELLRGEGLDARLARGALPGGEALRVAVEVARALAHAHDAGVVHRDLKPSNVFLTEEAGAKVLDFGLAHVLGSGDGIEGGTPRYMAPEQARRSAPDPRMDVYAAAVVLQETWLGPGLADARCRAPGPLPAAPDGLGHLVVRALSEDAARRPAGGREWLEALLAAQREVEGGPAPLSRGAP